MRSLPGRELDLGDHIIHNIIFNWNISPIDFLQKYDTINYALLHIIDVEKEVPYMDAFESALRIVKQSPKTYTKKEANRRLQSLGIMGGNCSIKKEYKGIIVNKQANGTRHH